MSEKYLNVLASEMDFVLHEALRVRQCVPPRRYKKHQTESVESASDEWNGVTLGIDRDTSRISASASLRTDSVNII